MKIAVVGATGRIGAKLTRTLLAAGHQVKALSRGGPALDELVQLGAEPTIGSFDTGAGAWQTFFRDAQAAFLMVKTDWNNIEGHYPTVAQRFVDALSGSSVTRAVSLSAMGSEVHGKSGHFESFYQLDQKLNELDGTGIEIVHLRAAWFMENTFAWLDPVAKYDRIAWSYEPDLKMPWVAIDDIAALAALELGEPVGQGISVREVGSEDLSMRQVTGLISQATGRPIRYRLLDRTRSDLESEYLVRFGSPEQWQDDNRTAEAMNTGVVRFRGDGEVRPLLPTSMRSFISDSWMPRYRKLAARAEVPETFHSWSAR